MFEDIGEDFWTGGGITAKKVSPQLRAIGDRPVEVQLNSPGGDMFEGIAIYNVLREHPQDITVKVMGMAASAASLIAMAGDTVEIGVRASS
jgi:ATP-dependent Clp protease protease subunit